MKTFFSSLLEPYSIFFAERTNGRSKPLLGLKGVSALFAAEVASLPPKRLTLWNITLTLGIQDHFFVGPRGFPYPPIPILSAGKNRIDKKKNKINEEKNN